MSRLRITGPFVTIEYVFLQYWFLYAYLRSRIFSLSLGLMFIGEAIGPALGSLLNRWTGQLITVFYGAIIVHLIYIVFVWIFLPQSLSLSYRFHAREKYAKTKRRDTKHPDCFGVRVFLFVKRLIYFLAPLAVFFPIRKTDNLTERRRRDWNLTMIGLAYSTAHLIAVYSWSRPRSHCSHIASVGIN